MALADGRPDREGDQRPEKQSGAGHDRGADGARPFFDGGFVEHRRLARISQDGFEVRPKFIHPGPDRLRKSACALYRRSR